MATPNTHVRSTPAPGLLVQERILSNFYFSKNPAEVAESLQETKAVTFNSRDHIVLIYIFMKVIIAV